MNFIVIDPDRIRATHTALALSQVGQAHFICSKGELDQLQKKVGRINVAFVSADLGADFVQSLKCCGFNIYVTATGTESSNRRSFYEAGAEEVVTLPLEREWIIRHFGEKGQVPAETRFSALQVRTVIERLAGWMWWKRRSDGKGPKQPVRPAESQTVRPAESKSVTLDELLGIVPKAGEAVVEASVSGSGFEVAISDSEAHKAMGKGKVIGLFSGTKGSVGKSTLACNLAALLHERGYKVAVVDADEQSRGATVMAFYGEDVCLPSRSDVLGGVMVHSITEPEASRLNGLKQEYDYVIVDFGNVINGYMLSLLRRCDVLLLITLPESLCVAVIHRFLRSAKDFQGPMRLVVNRYVVGKGLEPWEAARRLGMDCFAVVPDEITVIERAARRKTAAVFLGENALRQALEGIIEKLEEGVFGDEGVPEGERKGFRTL